MNKFFYGVFFGFMLSCALDLAIKDIEDNDRFGLQAQQREIEKRAEERLLERQRQYRHQFEQSRPRGVFNPKVDKET